MLIYQALYYVQLIVFQGGGRFQSLTEVRAFPAQSARLCLIRWVVSILGLSCCLYKNEEQKECRPFSRHDLNALRL